MRKIILIISVIVQINVWGLGGYGTLSGDAKKVADAIKENLSLNEEDTYQIYDSYLKGYLNTKNWHYNGYRNSTIIGNKIEKSDNKMYFINVVTDNRFINITFIKYAKEKQIYIHTVETLPRSSSIVIDKYNTLKNDKTFTVDTDIEEFSVFSKTDKTDRVKTLIYSGTGGIQYVDFYLHDLKK